MALMITTNDENRVDLTGFVNAEDFVTGDHAFFVDALPTEHSIYDYLYENGEFVYSPLPEPEPKPEVASELDKLEAQVTYTAMMTDTLLEVD
jgi:hypothetical protein